MKGTVKVFLPTFNFFFPPSCPLVFLTTPTLEMIHPSPTGVQRQCKDDENTFRIKFAPLYVFFFFFFWHGAETRTITERAKGPIMLSERKKKATKIVTLG